MIEVRYNLNMVPDKGSPIHINVSQNDDKCRTFIFKLYSSDGSWTAPASATATIEGRKDDGKFFSFACTYSNGEVTVVVQQQMVAVAGKVRCKLKLVSGAETIESAPFYFVVNPKSMPVNADMSKSDVVDAVAKATQKIVDQVAGSIPQDYVKLNEDVSGLKSDIANLDKANSAEGIPTDFSVEDGIISISGYCNATTEFWKHLSKNVESGEKLLVTGVSTNDKYPLFLFLKSDAVVEYSENNIGNDIPYTDIKVTVPPNVDKICVNTNVNLISNSDIKMLSYKNIENIAEKTKEKIEGNLVDGYEHISFDWMDGYINGSDGTFHKNNLNICFADTYLTGQHTIITNKSNGNAYIYEYGYDGTFKGRLGNILKFGDTTSFYGKRYIKISVEGKDLLSIANNIIIAKTLVYPTINSIGNTFAYVTPEWNNGYISAAGEINTVNTANRYTPNTIKNNGYVKIINDHSGTVNIHKYDQNDNYVHGSIYGINAGETYELYGSTNFRLSLENVVSDADTGKITIIVYTIGENLRKSTDYWNGKKIVWFGTSIPAGVISAGASNGTGSYPTRVGAMLGATVYNESVGSSAVRIGDHNSITSDDPNGYSGVPATCCLFSLSGTIDEKKTIISNWATWKSKFSSGTDAIDNIIASGTEQSQIYDRSYETKLTKYLNNGSVGKCDLYIIDHGYNDAGNKNGVDYSDLTKVPSDPLDRTYFIGAMNYIINKIKTNNFRASICIISHYNDEGVFKDLVEAQRYVADYWNIPFIEIFNKLGFSTAAKITINGQSKTLKDWWLPDGIHPSSDTTGAALEHYANVLYPLIRDVR